jgi:hypothetical protein
MAEDTVDITLKWWDPRTIKRDRRMIIVGKPGTGKTVAAVDVMSYIRDIPDGIVMSPTERYNGTWGGHVPPIALYNEYSAAAVLKVIERQEKIWNSEYRRKLDEAKERGEYVDRSTITIPPVFIIADDCMAEGAITRDKAITTIFMNGRHIKIFLLIMVQWLMDMPINKRQLVDYLLVCKEDSPPSLIRLYDNFFANYFPNYEAFVQVHRQVTQDHGVLVLDRTSPSDKFEDHIFAWKAREHSKDPRGSFKIGTQEWWDHSESAYSEQLHQPTNVLSGKSKGRKINVKYNS